MKINGEITSKLIKLQKENKYNSNYFHDNKFLIFSLGLLGGTSTVMSNIFEGLSYKTDEIQEYVKILKENNLFDIKDEKVLSRIVKSKETRNNLNEEIEEIINHLNTLTNRGLKLNTTREKRIKALYNTGKYNVQDFKAVNLYFTKLWGNDSKMKQYITPETLYNNKFDSRLEQAKGFFENFNKHAKEIQKLCGKFHKLVEVEIYPQHKLLASDIREKDLCKELPLQLQSTIVHWLDLNYDIETIINTIEITIDSWSKNPIYKNHISISKILDSKFPERVLVVQKKLSKEKTFTLKDSQSSVNNWLEKIKQKEGN